MINLFVYIAQESSAKLINEILEQRILPGSNLFCCLNLTNIAVTYWDERFRLCGFNDSFLDMLTLAPAERDFPYGVPFNKLCPMYYTQPELAHCIDSVHDNGGYASIDDCKLEGPYLDNEIDCVVSASKIDNYTVVTAYGLPAQTELSLSEINEFGRLQMLQKKERDLETALKVITPLVQRGATTPKSTQIAGELKNRVVQFISSGIDSLQQIRALTLLECISNLSDDPSFFAPILNSSGLTKREKEVAALVKMGKTTREIAEMLCLSTKTIDAQRTSINKKMGSAAAQRTSFCG